MDSFLRCVLPEPGTLFTSHNTQGGFSVCVCVCVCVCVSQSCPTLCNPMGCSPTGSSVRGISQARVLEQRSHSFELCAGD